MKCQTKVIGKVLRVSESRVKSTGQPVTYILLGFLGDRMQLIYSGAKPPNEGQDVVALVEGDIVRANVYNGERAVILPRVLLSYEVAKDVKY